MLGQNGKQTSYSREDNDTSYADGSRKHLLITSGGEATDQEYVRVMLAKPTEYSEDEIQAALQENASRPFSIFRRG